MKWLLTILTIIFLTSGKCYPQPPRVDPKTGNKTFYFKGKIYQDVKGRTYTDSVVVTPYSSVVLLYVSSYVVLPVTLVSFNTFVSANVLTLNWSTATESNNSYFIVEESEDGINWKRVKTIPSKAINGNSSTLLNYGTQIML